MSWSTPSKGWWTDWLTHERRRDLGSVWPWVRWVNTPTKLTQRCLNTYDGSPDVGSVKVLKWPRVETVCNYHLCLQRSLLLGKVPVWRLKNKRVSIRSSVSASNSSVLIRQVLSAFEDVSLQSLLDRIKEKHNLQKVKKVSVWRFLCQSQKLDEWGLLIKNASLLFFRN